jgi:hypothetical protein
MSGSPLRPVVPLLAQRGQYVPEVGKSLQVTLPGEIVRGVVEDVMSQDVCTVQLFGPVGMLGSKSGHTYKDKDIVACHRVIDDLGMEIWAPISRREVEMREEARRIARLEAEERELQTLGSAPSHLYDRPAETVAEVIPEEQSTPVTRLARRRRMK